MDHPRLNRHFSLAARVLSLSVVAGVGAIAAASAPPADSAPAAPKETEPAPPTARPPAADPNPPAVPTADDVVDAKPRSDLPRERIVLFGETFDAELCLDEATRNLGMGGRDAFPAGTAMVFVHPRPRVLNYWMKDCLIDMDMIFVDAGGRVASFHEAKRERLRTRAESRAVYEARLPRYGPSRPVQFVIELPPGSIKRLKPTLGQQVALDWAGFAKRAR